MNYFELILLALGLSMDAFAVAICKGMGMKEIDRRYTVTLAVTFAVVQILMPAAGWLIGTKLVGYIADFDHWIAFLLLALIGGNMIRESRGVNEEQVTAYSASGYAELLLLAAATGIDELAVGFSFSILEVQLLPALIIFACVTLCISFLGVFIGHLFGTRYNGSAERIGGIILILIGVKILIEHLLQ